MAIDLYSKSSTDTLLAAKYDASNPSGFISDAPIDGSTYGRNNGAWVVTGGGGSFLPLAGGAMDTGAVITIANSSTDIRYGSDYIGLNLTGSAGSTGATFDYNGINIFDGSNDVNLNPTQILAQNSTSSSLIVPASVTLNNGSSVITLAATGITFPNGSVQTVAANPFNGGTITGPITMDDGTIACQMSAEYLSVTYNPDTTQNSIVQFSGITSSNSSGYTQVNATGVRFPDGTTQTTAASQDWFAMSYAGICSALAVNLTSISNNVLTFNVGSAFIPQNVLNGGNIGLTQDGTNFYPFDTLVSGNNVFQASTFSLDTSNYAYLAFKDTAGTWHWCPNGIVFYP